jgi:hypothetical protein
MTVQISKREQQYLKTALTLVRAAQTTTDGAIATRLRGLADEYRRRAEKASHVDATRAPARSASGAEDWMVDLRTPSL